MDANKLKVQYVEDRGFGKILTHAYAIYGNDGIIKFYDFTGEFIMSIAIYHDHNFLCAINKVCDSFDKNLTSKINSKGTVSFIGEGLIAMSDDEIKMCEGY